MKMKGVQHSIPTKYVLEENMMQKGNDEHDPFLWINYLNIQSISLLSSLSM